VLLLEVVENKARVYYSSLYFIFYFWIVYVSSSFYFPIQGLYQHWSLTKFGYALESCILSIKCSLINVTLYLRDSNPRHLIKNEIEYLPLHSKRQKEKSKLRTMNLEFGWYINSSFLGNYASLRTSIFNISNNWKAMHTWILYCFVIYTSNFFSIHVRYSYWI